MSIRAGRKSRDGFAARLSTDLGKPVKAVADWQSCVEGADIVVEASRLPEPQPLLKTEWIKRGALVLPYGTMSAVRNTCRRSAAHRPASRRCRRR